MAESRGGDETNYDVLQYMHRKKGLIITFTIIELLTVTLLHHSFVCCFKTKYLFLMFQFIIFYIGQNINSLIKNLALRSRARSILIVRKLAQTTK